MNTNIKISIIGGGIGGLYAGALLSKHGFDINVFEANSKIGGYASSWKKGDYTFEASIHSINGFSLDHEKHETFDFLNLFKKIKILNIDSAFTSIFKDYKFKAPDNFEDFTGLLIKEFPDEKKQIEKVLLKIKKIARELSSMSRIKNKIILYLLLPFKFPNVLFNINNTIYNLINKKFKNPKLRTIITQLYTYYSDNIKRLNLLYFSVPTYSYLNGGFWISGTSANLSEALKEIIEKNNGGVYTSKNVKKIIFDEKNVAIGIQTSDNKEFYSDTIICNNSIKDVFNKLVDEKHINGSYRKKALKTIPSTSILGIYLGMSIDVRKLGLTDYSYFLNEIDDVLDLNIENDIAEYEKRPITIVSYNLDNSLAPEGKSVVTISTIDNISYWEKFIKNKNKYNKEKKRVANIILDRVEKVFPNFKKCIELIQIATPFTMRRFTKNPEGAVYGACQRVSQAHINRFPNQIKANNLYFTGAWVNPGGGISGVIASAIETTKLILNRYNIKSKF